MGNCEESQLSSAWVANANTRKNCRWWKCAISLSNRDSFHQVREREPLFCFEACVCNTIKQSNNICRPGKELLSADCHRKYFTGPCSHIWALEGSSPGRPRKLTPRKRLPRGAQRTSTLELQWLREMILSNSSCFWKETETWEVAGRRPPDINSRSCLRTQLFRSSCPMDCPIFTVWMSASVHSCASQLCSLTYPDISEWTWGKNVLTYYLFLQIFRVTANCWASFLLK